MAIRTYWQKSSFSGGGDGNDCVELASAGDRIRLREGDDPGTELVVTSDQLARLLGRVKDGRLGGA
ncbi:DUF397 domain-containing protein [Streptomyces sp. NPDC058439]|uniref:DUF397 domain-containing protein n=1 Tax=Streptomyces sp. NPDC058439 TaxID=3346500 RepID=UPI0036473382